MDGRGRRDGNFRGGFRNEFKPREMHKAVCSECGKECEVPFKPSNDKDGNPRPVYCKECYATKKPRRDNY